jgi:DNA transformation protein and related proteins
MRDRFEQAEFIEHAQPRGLQDQPRAQRPRRREALVDADVMAGPVQQQCGGESGGAATTDGDVESGWHVAGKDTSGKLPAMPRDSEFVRFVTDQMAGLGRVSARAMFGGYGIYRDDAMFAIIIDDQLYLKTMEATRARFAERGLKPFLYSRGSKTVEMSYFEAPAEVLDDPDAMLTWARLALEAAKPNPQRASAVQARAAAKAALEPNVATKDELSKLRNIGKAMRADFELLGVKSVAQLARCDADKLYARIQQLTATRHDPCVWDTYAAAIHQAKTGEALPWWDFTKVRKARQAKPARRKTGRKTA